MGNRLIGGIKRAFGWHYPGRALLLLPDDIFLVSYPKSGNTWMRFLVANLRYPNQAVDFGTINELIPAPEAMSKRKFARMERPRIIRTHDAFDPRYKRVIYVVRDPRDVVTSEYHYERKRRRLADDFPFEQFVGRFLAGEIGQHGSWGQNVSSWLVTRSGDRGFLLVRYEDLIADPEKQTVRVAEFLGVPPTPDVIRTAVEKSSADQMRKLEKEKSHVNTLTKNTRQDIPFVRSAKSGGWRSDLPRPALERIEGAWGHLLDWLAYERAADMSAGAVTSGANRDASELFNHLMSARK